MGNIGLPHTRGNAARYFLGMTPAEHCRNCGVALSTGARFCHRCGAPTTGALADRPSAGPSGAAGSATVSTALPWAVAAIALLCLLAFIVGQNFRRPAAATAVAAPPNAAPGNGPAPDISQMSPDERADRLFQRVMTYVAEGKVDSVRFFSPMAIQSMAALAPLNAHRRYDLGLLGVVSSDPLLAKAQADSILAESPDHLLGLILAMRTAGLQRDTTARRGYATKLLAVLERERAKQLQEYIDHAPDIEAAVNEAQGRAPQPSGPPPTPRD